jgi:putative transposase
VAQKKISTLPRAVRQDGVEWSEKPFSLIRQCELLSLHKSGLYYQPKGESEQNLRLMRKIDEQYLKTPFAGYRMMSELLRRAGEAVNEKRVRRLMRLMGLTALYPKPDLSKANKAHKKYPYLIRNMVINQVNQVWSSDITYIPMKNGFLYLVAVMDWYSRYVLSWELSNRMESSFCVKALQTALERFGRPHIFNTDQGVQFTSDAFVDTLLNQDILVSMDGKGRATDNVFIERLWRSVKYEDVYLKSYSDGQTLFAGLDTYFQFYNTQRPHQHLAKLTPAEVYYQLKEKHLLEKVQSITRT